MTEETLFAAALEKATPAERAALLDGACASDPGLRRRVEALLESHEHADFLKTPAIQRVAESLGDQAYARTIEAGASGADDSDCELDFLAASEKPDSLGRLGHYEILEVIGRGGMGIVLRGFDERLHRVVAIKVMAVPLASSAVARRRFTREAQAAAAVSHDHIVTIHAVEEVDGLPYLVMHYVVGTSLQERIDSDGPLQLAEILRIGMQAASGLAAAHAQGLTHRDIKPANILLENGVERVKITDFGLARAADDASATQSGIVAGTPQYMAPEQARGESVDQRADLFSLGSVLYAMCTGRAPFRASGMMAVLNRVCHEMPSPIRDANPEIPDWLVAIVEKLHAKDRDERYQSAAEVAEVLGRHLAHVQHPSVAAFPIAPASTSPPETIVTSGGRLHGHRRRWAIIVAALAVLLGSLSLTEATGVTNLATRVIRVLTPDGTLVVETDEPGVKVTVEGDGGLYVGTGLDEIHLRPGSYKIHADRDGKRVPLERELVSITRGGREVVKVKLEAASAQSAVSSEKGAFVLLAAGKELKFDTLSEAVLGASDGDTIEIRGNGPFVSDPVRIRHQLKICAGEGFRPLIRFSNLENNTGTALLFAQAKLVVEGLVFDDGGRGGGASPFANSIVRTDSQPLYVANCRFLTRDGLAIDHDRGGICQIRNCEMLGASIQSVAFHLVNGARILFNNNVVAGSGTPAIHLVDARSGSVQLQHNTVAGTAGFTFAFGLAQEDLAVVDPESGMRPSRVESAQNILDVAFPFEFWGFGDIPLQRPQIKTVLGRKLALRQSQDLLSRRRKTVGGLHHGATVPTSTYLDLTTLADWNAVWDLEEKAVAEGTLRYQGGNILERAAANRESLTPDDFRLSANSAGYRAGPDGKDLGADVDLVGPGPAYERWKKTPGYQEWLRDTKTTSKADSPRPESQAFVLLHGPNVPERRFDTLAEAVMGASDGDTIEIRGNGPFVTEPIMIRKTALTIRAGDGFRPTVRLSERAERANQTMLKTTAALRLEGIEFQRMAELPPEDKDAWPSLVHATGSALHVANCRFVSNTRASHRLDFITPESTVCLVRNCEFIGQTTVAMGATLSPCQRLDIDNCVHAGQVFLAAECGYHPRKKETSIRMAHNTVATGEHPAFWLMFKPAPEHFEELQAAGPIPVDAVANVFDVGGLAHFAQNRKALESSEVGALLLRVLSWRDRDTLLNVRNGLLNWTFGDESASSHTLRTLAEWRDFWRQPDASVSDGVMRYTGGDLWAKLAAAPLDVKPEDFRLRPDSAGYRAGKDGKDLGADVEFVGPGPAYERWKKTPEYQEWLKDTKPLSKGDAAGPEPKAFALLGGQGVAERQFDTLAEALLGASEGDTIEVRANGPFLTDAIEFQNALTIRAGTGFRPVFVLNPDSKTRFNSALFSSHTLRLEGLEFRSSSKPYRLLYCSGPLWAANCRFQRATVCIECENACVVRNCELLSADGAGLVFKCNSDGRFEVANCINVGHINLEESDITRGASIRFGGNTFVSPQTYTFFHDLHPMEIPEGQIRNHAGPRVQVASTENILACANGVFYLGQNAAFEPRLDAGGAEAWIPRRVQWEEERNLFRPGMSYIGCGVIHPTGQSIMADVALTRGKDFADWNRFWGLKETGSSEGHIRFHGGDLFSRAMADVTKLTPEDFRLRPDSAGYRAGKQGNNLGADVDLVGPGPAYERWKKTPEYKKWLEETRP